MCTNFQVIGGFAFKKNLQISSNFLHFEPKKEHLECGPFENLPLFWLLFPFINLIEKVTV